MRSSRNLCVEQSAVLRFPAFYNDRYEDSAGWLASAVLPAPDRAATPASFRESHPTHAGRLERRVVLVAGQQAHHFPVDARRAHLRSGVHHECRWLRPAHGLDRQRRHHLRLLHQRQQAHHLRFDARRRRRVPHAAGSQQGLCVGGLSHVRYLSGHRHRQDHQEADRHHRLRRRRHGQFQDQEDALHVAGFGRSGDFGP